MEKKTKKAKTVKTAKTTKSTKSTKATKTKKVKKATRTTKSTKSTKATKIAKKELTAKDRKKVTGGERSEIGYLFGQYKRIRDIKKSDMRALMNEANFKSRADLGKYLQDISNGDGSITFKYEND